jgi:hypothetical protein
MFQQLGTPAASRRQKRQGMLLTAMVLNTTPAHTLQLIATPGGI